jgi:hypothetical protein
MDNSNDRENDFIEKLENVVEEIEKKYINSNKSNPSYSFLLINLSAIHSIDEFIAESNRIRHFLVDSYDGDTELLKKLGELFLKYGN